MWDQGDQKELERKGRDRGLKKEAMESWTFPHVKWLLEAPVPVGAFNHYVKASNINWIFSICIHLQWASMPVKLHHSNVYEKQTLGTNQPKLN